MLLFAMPIAHWELSLFTFEICHTCVNAFSSYMYPLILPA